jgi:hypothetical protein
MSSIKKLLIQKQIDDLIQLVAIGEQRSQLHSGWIQTIRLALGMSLRQLSERIGVSPSALNNFEKREQTEAISLASLKKVANAMDMELVYYLKPKQGSIHHTIKKQARLKALEILEQSNQTMKLENQETSIASQEIELERLTNEISIKTPANLWD